MIGSLIGSARSSAPRGWQLPRSWVGVSRTVSVNRRSPVAAPDIRVACVGGVSSTVLLHRFLVRYDSLLVGLSLANMRYRKLGRWNLGGGMAVTAKKILCIEDDRETAALIVEELAERGFDVLLAYEGHEGFVAILKGIPDLVLCDVGLPNMSGFEILERLNELSPRLEKIPFVFLTALSDRDNELRGRQLGADDYVIKPIDFDILESVINARLAGVARNRISACARVPKPLSRLPSAAS
jgi:CheY-like chemotaxis protein